MDNAIILKLYNGDISSIATSASVLMGRFFPYMKVVVSIILCGTCAKQFSVLQEIMQFIPKLR